MFGSFQFGQPYFGQPEFQVVITGIGGPTQQPQTCYGVGTVTAPTVGGGAGLRVIRWTLPQKQKHFNAPPIVIRGVALLQQKAQTLTAEGKVSIGRAKLRQARQRITGTGCVVSREIRDMVQGSATLEELVELQSVLECLDAIDAIDAIDAAETTARAVSTVQSLWPGRSVRVTYSQEKGLK